GWAIRRTGRSLTYPGSGAARRRRAPAQAVESQPTPTASTGRAKALTSIGSRIQHAPPRVVVATPRVRRADAPWTDRPRESAMQARMWRCALRRRSPIGAQTVSASDSADGDGGGLGPDEAVDRVGGRRAR